MKRKILFGLSILAFVSMFALYNSFIQNEQAISTSLDSLGLITKAEAKVQGEWCSTGIKNKDEHYTWSFWLGKYVCSCEEDFDDCCKCN